MSVTFENTIAELEIRRDIARSNAAVASGEAQEKVKESNRLNRLADEIDDAIMILADRDS